MRISRIVIIFTIFHLIPLALALVVHGTEYVFDLSSKLTLGRGIVFFSKVLGRAWAWWASINPVVFRTIDVVAVPRFRSIVKIRILIALEIVRELILVVRKILPKKGAINQSKMAIKPTEKKESSRNAARAARGKMARMIKKWEHEMRNLSCASCAYHNLGSISLLPFALAAGRGNDGGVDDVPDHVIDERSRHGTGVFCVRVRVL